MNKRFLTLDLLTQFKEYLLLEEKSTATIEKYYRDVCAFFDFAENREITKELVMEYKRTLLNMEYKPRSINSMLASINSLWGFLRWEDCRVKNIKIQQAVYCAEEQELTKKDYLKLVEAAKKKPRLCLLLQTICGTGIRVSELSYFTVEAVTHGEIIVSCKNKTRTILLPAKLRKMLLNFCKKNGIKEGVIFRTKTGKSMDRSNIWRELKKLCRETNVNLQKVFPHNLRKLFARTFYSIEKDIAKLADILGHSSINTTRIYIMTTCMEHRRKIEKLGLVV